MMKNRKLARELCIYLTVLLMFAGCQSKERRQRKQNEMLTRKFAEWVAQKADMDALVEINAGNGHKFDYFGDKDIEEWLAGKQKDSVKYREALNRDAVVVLDYVRKCKNMHDVWAQIEKAPKYTYGPGSVLNENGEWEYCDSVNNGASREALLGINCAKYTECLMDLYGLRSEQRARK